jgi:predicted nucleotidyltransferase
MLKRILITGAPGVFGLASGRKVFLKQRGICYNTNHMEEDILVKQLKQINPQAIILFGSGAKGKRTIDSDYDFLVIKETNKQFADRIREAHSILKTNIPVDVIVVTPKEAEDLPKKSVFFSHIIQEGKLVYGRI